MSMNTPPPQAYTRDTITRAYEWLQSQPSHIRELAHDIDGMVSLFLQAQRRGGKGPSLNQKPVNPNDFQNDLKNLAEGLRQFEEPETTAPQTPTPAAPAMPTPPPMPPQAPTVAPSAPVAPSTPMTSAAPTATNTQVATSQSVQLDARSQECLNQLRKCMNLSSDQEALRVLIAMGFEHLRQILPKT